MIDVIFAIVFAIVLIKTLIDIAKLDIKENKRFKFKFEKEESYMSKVARNKLYGVMLTLIGICLVYIFLRLSGRL
jgi:hypothetical protein